MSAEAQINAKRAAAEKDYERMIRKVPEDVCFPPDWEEMPLYERLSKVHKYLNRKEEVNRNLASYDLQEIMAPRVEAAPTVKKPTSARRTIDSEFTVNPLRRVAAASALLNMKGCDASPPSRLPKAPCIRVAKKRDSSKRDLTQQGGVLKDFDEPQEHLLYNPFPTSDSQLSTGVWSAHLTSVPTQTYHEMAVARLDLKRARRASNLVFLSDVPWGTFDDDSHKGQVRFMGPTTRPFTYEDLPSSLQSGLCLFMARLRDPSGLVDSVTGEPCFMYVSWNGPRHLPFKGWQVQVFFAGRLHKIAVVQQSLLGAVVAIASKADERIRCHRSAWAWLLYMNAAGDEAARIWMKEVATGLSTIPWNNAGRRSSGKDKIVEQQQPIDSSPYDDLPPIPTFEGAASSSGAFFNASVANEDLDDIAALVQD
jgi:hypothetical protein